MTPLFTPEELRTQIVRPTLFKLNFWQPAREDLLVGTAIQESALTYIKQQGNGPALGLWQMEPFTHDDCWNTWLDYHSAIGAAVKGLIPGFAPSAALLPTNHAYACAMAFVRYYRSSYPLPAYKDVAGYAAMWKTVYNTAKGAGTEQEFIDHWKAAGLPA